MSFQRRDQLIPLCRPWTDESEVQAVREVLESGWLSTGPRTANFEREFAERVGARHAIAVSSCTAALHLTLVASGIGDGDEVITTPFTFTATAEAIGYAGALPVFVDIDPQTLNLRPADILPHLTERTRVILPVHIAGHPCDMQGFQQIASEHSLLLLDDAAHAIGTDYRGKPIGSWGDASAFSFYATKNLTSAEGGMITTPHDGLADAIRLRRLHGISKDAWARQHAGNSWHYQVVVEGFKYNLSDVHAAIAECQLKKFSEFQLLRRQHAKHYQHAFAPVEAIHTPTEVDDGKHAWHLFIVRLDTERIGRDAFIRGMRELNVECGVHFIPLHLHPYYQQQYGYAPGDFPRAEAAYNCVVSLPLYPSMHEDDVQYVVDAAKQVIDKVQKR